MIILPGRAYLGNIISSLGVVLSNNVAGPFYSRIFASTAGYTPDKLNAEDGDATGFGTGGAQ